LTTSDCVSIITIKQAVCYVKNTTIIRSYSCNMFRSFFRPYSGQRTYVYCEHWNTKGCEARSINLYKNL